MRLRNGYIVSRKGALSLHVKETGFLEKVDILARLNVLRSEKTKGAIGGTSW